MKIMIIILLLALDGLAYVWGFFQKVEFKSSLILKSRYSSNIFSKLGQIIFSKLFYSFSSVVDRFKLLQANKNITPNQYDDGCSIKKWSCNKQKNSN